MGKSARQRKTVLQRTVGMGTVEAPDVGAEGGEIFATDAQWDCDS